MTDDTTRLSRIVQEVARRDDAERQRFWEEQRLRKQEEKVNEWNRPRQPHHAP